MVTQYTRDEFERFAKGIKKASDILRSNKPDYIFAPIVGGVPFIDLFALADRHFNLDIVEYPPNSSRFSNREEIMSKWYNNFLNTNYHGDKINIVCIDEVISGSSAVKGYQEFKKALFNFNQRIGESLDKKVFYFILGIAEKPRNGKRNHGISKLVNKRKAKLIDVGKILTVDNPDLNPVRLKIKANNYQGRHIYLPEIEKFEVSEEYLTFLQNFASYIGEQPSRVSVKNLGKIKESLEKYLNH